MKKTLFTILLIAQSSVSALFAQTAPVAPSAPNATPAPKAAPTPVEDDEVLRIDSKLVMVPVSVTDAKGLPVNGLKREDFTLEEESKLQEIAEIGVAEDVPLEIVLLFDVSASTDTMFKFEQETAAQFLANVMRPQDRASIFTIGEKGVLVQGRESAEVSAGSIKAIQPSRQYTAFYDSLIAATNYVKQNTPPNRRKVFIVISDGEDTFSSLTKQSEIDAYHALGDDLGQLDSKKLRKTIVKRDEARRKAQAQVLKALQNVDAVLYSVNPAGNSYHLNIMSVYGQQTMQRFADETGGTAFLPKKAEDLAPIFRRISTELRAQYLLQYYTDATAPVGTFLKLKVATPKNPALRVRSRLGYFMNN
jgi:VWFA-related protein